MKIVFASLFLFLNKHVLVKNCSTFCNRSAQHQILYRFVEYLCWNPSRNFKFDFLTNVPSSLTCGLMYNICTSVSSSPFTNSMRCYVPGESVVRSQFCTEASIEELALAASYACFQNAPITNLYQKKILPVLLYALLVAVPCFK